MASTALYGALSLPICIFALDLSPSDLLDAAAERNGLSGWFSAYVVVSLAAYPALMALKVLMIKVGTMIARRSIYNGSVWGEVPTWLYHDLTNPFRGLRAPIGARHSIQGGGFYDVVQWFTVILFFGWSIALWLWLAVGLIAVAR